MKPKRIQTNCELPNSMLQMNCNLNDYDFVLYHLYATNATYREYYKALRKYRPGRLMILDNSAYEFYVKGESIDEQGYRTVIEELQPDIYLLPDVLMHKDATLEASLNFAKETKLSSHSAWLGPMPMGVLQGNSVADFEECLHEYRLNDIKCIAVPFHNDFFKKLAYEDEHLRNEWRLNVSELCSMHHKLMTTDDDYAIGRVVFMRELKRLFDENSGYEYHTDYIHMLGSHNPYEKHFIEPLQIVNSMDTGYPVKCGIAGYELGKEPGKPDIIIDEFLDEPLTKDAKKLIAMNIKKFTEY